MADLQKVRAAIDAALTELGEPTNRYEGLARTKLEEAWHWLNGADQAAESGPQKAERYGQIAREHAGLNVSKEGTDDR